MALETGPVFVDEKDVAVAGTPEALTDREIHCSSVTILPKTGEAVFVVDFGDDDKTFPVPVSGITLPINDPRRIRVDVSVNTEGMFWLAV